MADAIDQFDKKMKQAGASFLRSLLFLGLALRVAGPLGAAQMPTGLEIRMCAGLTITGVVGAVYEIRYSTDLAPTNNPSGWRCLEYLRLPARPYQWTDQSAPATQRRFYQALVSPAPSNMVFIPPGVFRMGSPTNEAGRSLKEGPQTEVTISHGFWMGKYLVTQGEYQGLVGTNPSFFSAANGYSTDLSRPVDSVSWFDATSYCDQLTRQERMAGRIPGNCEYRLPTEAEWEFACRALTSTRFSYGDDPGYTNLSSYGWYYADSGDMTHAVGQKLPNPWGLCDVHGNLEEWCLDWYGAYQGGIAIDPQGPPTGALRVLRGGYWENPPSECRSAFRNEHEPGARHSHIGFRLVLAPGPA